MKNLEAWEKRARQLIAINSHADLCSSAAYLCLQQESMSVAALSRRLEAVAKSIKHATAMSTILTTAIFQARRDAALASSKLLLDISSYESRNTPINSKTLFDGRIKEVDKANYEAQQQRFLASTSSHAQVHQQKPFNPPRAFTVPKIPTKQSRPKPTQTNRPKTQTQSVTTSNKKDFSERSGNVIFFTVTQRRDRSPSQETGSGKGTESGNTRFLFPDIPCTKKERKVTANKRSIFIEPIHKETSIQNGDSQVCKKNRWRTTSGLSP